MFSQELECVKCRRKKRRYVYNFDGEKISGRLYTIETLVKSIDQMDVWCDACIPTITRRVQSAGRRRHKQEAAMVATVRAHSQIASSYDAEVLDNGLMLSKRSLAEKVKATPCMVCGAKYPAPAMDFHHVRGNKVAEISTMVNKPYTLKDLIEEMQKCIVLCAICHRLVHSKEPPDVSKISPLVLTKRMLKLIASPT